MRVMCSNVVPVIAPMGSFLRRAAQVGSMAGILMGITWGGVSVAPVLAQESYLLAQAAPAGPMSRQEVAERLNLVPVFAIVSKDGTPVVANVDREGRTVQVASFWLDQAQAQQVLEQVKASNPEVASQAQVVPLSLGYAYEKSEEERAKNGDLLFEVVPRPSDVEAAKQVLQQTGQNVPPEAIGVPLFYGRSGEGLLTIEQDGYEVVPFFFDRNDLRGALDRAAAQNPDVVQQTQIEVTSLAIVVERMLAPDAQADVQKIAFIPSRSSLEYIQSLARPANP
ncbi:chitin deacetylase [Synechococcus bigranulatus str. 'Rupite']|uniref:Chitin deacetylase n=2 Tax=Thermostichus vulcanus TaxID=32053 RepID=A0ABT0CCW2_THEVL|nr:chitin deacetylase [Thermostichus vulcanus str. 'Rupite']